LRCTQRVAQPSTGQRRRGGVLERIVVVERGELELEQQQQQQ
jgi:hypothetical protein